MPDIVSRKQGCLIQHGPHNDRIYVMKCGDDLARIIPFLEDLAQENTYGKTMVKVPSGGARPFFEAGFIEEARIPGFFSDDDCLFLARFHRLERQREEPGAGYDDILEQCRQMEVWVDAPALPDGYALRQCRRADAGIIAGFTREIFPSYPFPIDDPAHVREMMGESTRYYGVSREGRLVAVSSAEMDLSSASVEMTDFATHPDHRGKRLARILLRHMEGEMQVAGMKTAYTIARADSLPVSVIFTRSGYRFGGRLVNNTNICGSLRSMNVWYRHF